MALGTRGQPIDALNLLRLGVAAGDSLDAFVYRLMGEIATRLGFFGDAATAERHGAYSDAAAIFPQVSGSARKAADLWLGYAQHKAAPAAVAAPAATPAH